MHVIPGVISIFDREVVNDSKETYFQLGKIEDVIAYYDQAQLFFFTAQEKGKEDSRCEFLSVHIDQNIERDVWLNVPVTQERKKDILEGKVSLQDAFAKSESGEAFVVIKFQSGRELVGKKKISLFPKEWFPEQGDFVNPEISEGQD